MPDLNKPLFDSDMGLARPTGELSYLRKRVRELTNEVEHLRRYQASILAQESHHQHEPGSWP